MPSTHQAPSLIPSNTKKRRGDGEEGREDLKKRVESKTREVTVIVTDAIAAPGEQRDPTTKTFKLPGYRLPEVGGPWRIQVHHPSTHTLSLYLSPQLHWPCRNLYPSHAGSRFDSTAMGSSWELPAEDL